MKWHNETSRRDAGNTTTALTTTVNLMRAGTPMADEKPTHRRRRVQAYAPGTTCEIEGCEKPAAARGWCGTHYMRWKTHGDPAKIIRIYTGPRCEAPDCKKPTVRSRYCEMHRARLRRYGSFHLPPRSNRHDHSMGYQLIRRPGHPLAQVSSGEWVYEHRVVLYEAIGPGAHSCHWCGTEVTWHRTYPQDANALVVDHVDENRVNNNPANLVPSCGPCNFQRSSRWVKRQRQEGQD